MMRPAHVSKIRLLTFVLAVVVGVLFCLFTPQGHKSAHAESAQGSPPAKPGSAKHVPEKAAPPPKGAAKATPDAGATADAGTPPAPEPAAPEPPAKEDKAAKDDKDDIPIPTGKGLPIEVQVAVFFLDVKSFDDTKGEFECTTDVRLRWYDLGQRYPASEAYRGYKEFRGKKAEAVIEKIWTPAIEVSNRTETGPYTGRRLRIYPDGQVELITRTTAKHTTHVDAQSFPFDMQKLTLDILLREQTTDEVVLEFEKEDVEWSRVSPEGKLDGWDLGLVVLEAGRIAGWNGDRYSKVSASLHAHRLWSTGLAPIFIPLFASLLIPLLALWMNTPTEEGFAIEAFELANIGIGGLFSVIALSFAVYSSYGVIAGSDNTVTRLFGLNYATLAISLAVVVFFFRFNVPLRLFGHHVQTQLFRCLLWALPVLTAGTALAFLAVAAQ